MSGDEVHLTGPRFDTVHRVMQLGNCRADLQKKSGAAPDRIAATMPGLVVEVRAGEGAEVAAGDTLIVMESMKLLMELKATASGTVAAVRTAPVFHGDTLRVRTTVGKCRKSGSRPGAGIVKFRHEAFNQDDILVASCERAAFMHRRPDA